MLNLYSLGSNTRAFQQIKMLVARANCTHYPALQLKQILFGWRLKQQFPVFQLFNFPAEDILKIFSNILECFRQFNHYNSGFQLLQVGFYIIAFPCPCLNSIYMEIIAYIFYYTHLTTRTCCQS